VARERGRHNAIDDTITAPIDDGAARGLEGQRLPHLRLGSTLGGEIDLASAAPLLVLYVYPHATGTPEAPAPGWAQIPGAVGCTAEACAFRDRVASFADLGATVMGLSAQTTEAQRAFTKRKEVTFALLSDLELRLARALHLPTFEAGGLHLYKRLTLIADAGLIVKVFYPVFPPDLHPAQVLDWIGAYRDRGALV
jgi:peroxiredoxin